MAYVETGKAAVEKILDKIGGISVKSLSAETFKDELYSAFPSLNGDYDTTFLMDLLSYFPLDKVSISAGSYDQYLFDLQKTVIDNYEKGNYQVSYFYAHLIFMSHVYYCVERAYHLRPERMKDIFYPINSYRGREDKPDIEHYRSVYEFSKIPEKEIFKVFRIMEMDDQQIKDMSSYISSRDNFAHATGEGNISEDALIQNVRTIKGNMDSLHRIFCPDLRTLYIQYLLDFSEEEYATVYESVFDFAMDNAFSLADIGYLCNLGISSIRNENDNFKEKYRFVKKVHCTFIEYCIENFGVEPPTNYADLYDEAFIYYKYANNADEYVESELGISAYLCGKEGGVFPVFECVDCGEEQLAYDATQNKYHCFACDENYSGDELCFCTECGSIMHVGEMDICENCIAWKLKD